MHLINQRVTDEWKMWREFRSMHCVYQLHVSINVLRLIICRFQSHLLLLVYKLYSLFFLFWIQEYFRKYSSLRSVSNSSGLLQSLFLAL